MLTLMLTPKMVNQTLKHTIMLTPNRTLKVTPNGKVFKKEK